MAKSVFLDGEVNLGGYTIWPTSVKINEDHKIKMIEYMHATVLTPPTTDWEPLDIETIRCTIEGFMETDELTSYPARGEEIGTVVTVPTFFYSGSSIITSFTIDAVFDGAVKVTIGLTFTSNVNKINY